MEMVAETDGNLEVCVSMTTYPPGAMLATQVDLTLSTVNGSGKTLCLAIVCNDEQSNPSQQVTQMEIIRNSTLF